MRTLSGVTVLFLAAAAATAGDGGLVAELAGPRDAEGRFVVVFPGEGPLGLSLLLTNKGEEPVEVVLSDYPVFRHAKLDVARVLPDGSRAPLEAWFDLYPMKDMKAPEDEATVLAPGESVSRSFQVLLREGYLLKTLGRFVRGHYLALRSKGYGALREPGEYELTGSYTDGSGEEALRTAPLRVVVRYPFSWDGAARREAGAARIVLGTVSGLDDASADRDSGAYVPYRVTIEEVLKGDPADALTFHVLRGPSRPGPEIKGDRLLHLVEVTGKLYLLDERSAPEADDEGLAETRARLSFLEHLADEPLLPAEDTEAAVGKLVDRMTESPEAQREALRALEAMGNRAVRSLIPFLDDPRRLAEETVSFPNRAEDAFEAVRHYRPVTVGKALACLLNQITGESFESERAWRIYAHYVPER